MRCSLTKALTSKTTLPHPSWAFDIQVEEQDWGLLVSGMPQPWPMPEAGGSNLLRDVLDASRKSAARGRPHLEFANAQSRAQLQAWVKSYGPVYADDVKVGSPVSTRNSDGELKRVYHWGRTGWTARQHWTTLKAERDLFRYAAECVRFLQSSGQDRAPAHLFDIGTFFRHLSRWNQQWQAEQLWRAAGGKGTPNWLPPDYGLFNTILGLTEPDLRETTVPIIQKLLQSGGLQGEAQRNADAIVKDSPFRVSTQQKREVSKFLAKLQLQSLFGCFEPSPLDRSITTEVHLEANSPFGVRPQLYQLLAMDYNQHGCLKVCADPACGAIFPRQRRDQKFCSPACRLRVYMRVYMRKARHGRPRRRQPAKRG